MRRRIALKRAATILVPAVAVAALALPLSGLRAGASVSAYNKTYSFRANFSAPAASAAAHFSHQPIPADQPLIAESPSAQDSSAKLDPDLLRSLGISRSKDKNVSERIAQAIRNRLASDFTAQSGQPVVLNARSALSTALITTIGGRDNQFSEAALIADWDGREDCAADREQKVADFSFNEIEPDFTLTRAAISEHTYANGFFENVYYYGDTVGNLWVGIDQNPGINLSPNGAVDSRVNLNIPDLVNTGFTGPDANGDLVPDVALLNPIAGDCTDDQVTVTGIAVNPVSDLADFGLCGQTGEVVYVSIVDTEGCSSTGANQPFRTRIFAIGFLASPGGETAVGAIQLLRSPLWNVAGVAVDDDSNLYFQLADLISLANGAAIFKVTELPRAVAGCAANPRINRVIASMPNGLSSSNPITLSSAQGTTANPVLTSGGYRLTNYSGPSTTFGNMVAMDAGPCNVLYAALARSFAATDDRATQDTEGLFTNPAALGATPSMIISFADCSGGFDLCSAPAFGQSGQIPAADGIADVAALGLTPTAGVNNFRVFALGNGPDIRPTPGQTSAIVTSSTLRVDLQIDFTAHSGINVSEEGTVFVISGGTPAGVGNNPSPRLSEILCFEDICPMDRRADFVDLRGDSLPNPPYSGGNTGDGDSDRFDHIFYQAPIDQITVTPGGLSGLARGFLLYTSRVRGRNEGTLANLPNGTPQGDDATSGVLIFEDFDAGHQVAGGDDQNPGSLTAPLNRGDDNDGAGNPVLSGALSGGFEFVFGEPVGASGCVWNGFFLNSNGNITFGTGDTDGSPTVIEFRAGLLRLAPAWADLNTDSRSTNVTTFPLQALGFAGVNAFRVRWLNVPEFSINGSLEACSTSTLGGIGGNTFSVTMYDDGTGVDENASQSLNPANPIGNNSVAFDLQEGPTDLRWASEPNTNILVGCTSRPQGSGIFVFEYCRMNLLGTAGRPVISGYSIGFQPITNPPALCEINLSEAARATDANPFAVVESVTAAFCNCLLGEGTEPALFELFNEGRDVGIGTGGEIVFATPDFDLRFEGNAPALCQPARQRNPNRGKIAFYGVGCAAPANAQCAPQGSSQIVPAGPVLVAPNQPAVGSTAAGTPNANGVRTATPTAGIINALCAVQLNVVGCGFFPNEVTTVCPGFTNETGQPLQRQGKTVTTAATLVCDTDGNGMPDAVIVLANVTPINCNLVRGTLSPPGVAAGSSLPGSAFPATCCGGFATLMITTTFTAGDNNIFGVFTKTTACAIDLGLRAPVVFSASPSEGNCAVVQDLLVSGACFIINTASGPMRNVTSVFAVQSGNPSNRIQGQNIVVINPNLLDVVFNFGSANAGRTFLIFASGPNGQSRNLLAGDPRPTGCPAGNEQGVSVTFTCSPSGQGCPPDVATPGCPCPPNVPPGTNGCVPTSLPIPVINGCRLNRDSGGRFVLDVFGSNIRRNATAVVGGVMPRKIKFREADPGIPDAFRRIRLKGGICDGLPGTIVVTNPAAPSIPPLASQPFLCSERCPAN